MDLMLKVIQKKLKLSNNAIETMRKNWDVKRIIGCYNVCKNIK